MYRYNLLIFCYVFLLTIATFSNVDNLYQQKKYGVVLKESSLLLKKTFNTILSESYQALPFSRQMTSSNYTYSFDMQKNHINYNIELEYIFDYDSKIKISLVYASEEVSYYQMYIDNAKYSTISNSFSTFPLKKTTQGFYLWDIDESIAYYVYSFTLNKQNSKESINIIPGLLLKIQFQKNNKHNEDIDSIVNLLITNTNWKKLEQLYALN